VKLVRFLLNREGGKVPLLTALKDAVMDTTVKLQLFRQAEQAFLK
jgi:hypothetical protein